MYFLADFAKKKIDHRENSRNNLANNVVGDKTTMKKIRKKALDKLNLNTLIEDRGEIPPELKPAPSDSGMVIKPRKEGLGDLKKWIRSKS